MKPEVCPLFEAPDIADAQADPTICVECGKTEPEHDNPFGKPESCRPCPLFNEPGPVWPSGPENADLFMLGEGPGAEEVDFPYYRRARFKPFVGGAGRLLSALCAHAQLIRPIARIGNVVMCRPPANRVPTALEIRCCAPFLIEELERCDPNVIVALGDTALSVITDKQGISLYRGVPVEGFQGRKVFPTWHPSFIARQQYNWPFAVHDLARAQAQSAFPEIRRIPFDIVRDARVETHGDALLRAARERGAVTFDFETTGLSADRDSIVMVGLAAGPDQAHVFDWTPSARKLFQTLLDDPAIEIVGQNVLYFDLPFAQAKGVDVSKAWNKTFDTMVAFHLANASYGATSVFEQDRGTYRAKGMDKDLVMIASCHTDIPYWKSREAYRRDLRGVCGTDCIATDRSALTPGTGLKDELALYGMTDLYYKHVLPVHPILDRMHRQGFKIDEDRAARWAIVLERQADELEGILKEGLGDPYLNLNSPKQLMELLYGKLGLPVQYTVDRKKGTRPTANSDALEALAELAPENAILRTIVDIRHLRKLKSTYIDPGLLAGRLFPRIGVSKAANGRFNSWGPNAQNVPEETRDIWVPDDDEHIILAGDWSQIEWRAAMVLSADPVGLELLTSGVDTHRAVAAATMNKLLEEITDEERHSAKFIVYGLGYGRGADSIADGHNLDLSWVRSFIRDFFNRFSEYTKWREEIVELAQQQHYLANAFKRRRWWYTRQITEVYNYPPSSTAADMMYEALIDLDRELPKGADLRLTVHDEVVLNVAKDVAREAWICTRDNMQRKWDLIVEASRRPEVVRRFYPEGWYCPVDLHAGTNWKMAKSKDPEDKRARTELERYLGLEGL